MAIQGSPVEDEIARQRCDDAEPDPLPRPRLNVLCMIGVAIGLASVFLAWIWWETAVGPNELESTTLATMVKNLPSHLDSMMFQGGCIFIAGVFIALKSPLGGLVQVLGLSVFYIDEIDWEAQGDRLDYDSGVGLGFFVACLSTGLVLASLVRPTGIGYSGSMIGWSEKVRTIIGHPRRPYWVWLTGAVRRNEAWVLALVIPTLLITAVIIVEGEPIHDEPMEEIEGGVMWLVEATGHAEWDDGTVSLTDGSETVLWDTVCDSLSEGVWAANVYVARDLSGVNLTLTIVDSSGNGRMNPGDTITLVAGSGTSFAEGVQYRLTVTWDLNCLPNPVPLDCCVYFEFQDGELSSRVAFE